MTLLDDKKIAVVMLDDHPMMRFSFEVAATREPDISMLATFGNSKDLLDWLRINHADVLVLDYILGNDELDGLSLIKQILSHHPQLKILLSSSMESVAVIHAALQLGIKGYITKREETPRYFAAIRTIAAGQRSLPDDIANELDQLPIRKRERNALLQQQSEASTDDASRMAHLSKRLTPREAEVIRCFIDGMQVVEIAIKLKRSRKTISGHKQTGMKKLGLTSDLELFKYRDDLFK